MAQSVSGMMWSTKITQAFLLVTLLVSQSVSAYNVGARSSSSRSPASKLMMSWKDPQWNWGSAAGKAHDVAMTTRGKLRSKEERQKWLEALAVNSVDPEEMKMVIALRMQLASRQGKDGCGAGWNLMCDMADCKYEDSGGIEALKGDLEILRDKLPDHLVTSVSAPESDSLGYVAACALAGSDFVVDGL